MKLKKIHKQRLLKLAKFLRTKAVVLDGSPGKHNLFDMFQWLQPDKKGHMHRRASLSCGTPACAAGWATAIFPELIYNLNHRHIHMRGEKCTRPHRVAFYDHIAKFFGLDDPRKKVSLERSAVYKLFGPAFHAAEKEADLIERFVKQS